MLKSSNFFVLHTSDADPDTSSGAPGRRSRSLGFACILSVLFFGFLSNRVHGDLAADENGLLLLKQSIDPLNTLNWTAGSDVCTWDGVNCTRLPSQTSLRVIEVNLSRRGLTGPIPPNSLSQVTELRVINLHSNRLSGSLPADLVNCTFVRGIHLQNNLLLGRLPSDFSAWPNLNNVDFSSNQFTGTLPASLANLRQIRSLYLQNNSLTGSLPSLDISSLLNFNVSYNNLTGSIPNTATYRKFDSFCYIGNNLCDFPLLPCGAAPASGPAPGLVPPSSGGGLSRWAIVGIVIAGVVFLLLLCLLCILARKRSKSLSAKQANPYEASAIDDNLTGERGPKGEAPLGAVAAAAAAASSSEPDRNKLVFFEGNKYTFTLEDLLRASAEVLGKGTVGTSYKAILESGIIVAVKRLKDVSIEKNEFEKRMEYYGGLKHENLVPLIAYYYSREEKLLVANYMANGSLSALLHGNKEANRTPLDWDTRSRIALGAAQGINHLHGDNITHGNIKSSNVLLTSNYTGCVSDFGLTQLVNASSTASRMAGYRAPEVTDIRKTTPQSDVYSFGVLLLEILTGKPPSQASMTEEGLDLPRWVESVPRDEEDWRSKVFDPQLTRFEGSENEMDGMLEIALDCVKPSPDQRPTMNEVVNRLENSKQHDGVY